MQGIFLLYEAIINSYIFQTIVGGLLTRLLFYIAQEFSEERVIQWVYKYLWNQPTSCELIIPQYTVFNLENDSYEAMVYFVNTLPIHEGDIVGISSTDLFSNDRQDKKRDVVIFTLGETSRCIYDFQGHTLEIRHNEYEKNKETLMRFVIETDGGSNVILRKFLKSACDAYVEFKEESKWESKVLEYNDGWNGHTVSNTKTFDNTILEKDVHMRLVDDLNLFRSRKEWYYKRGVPWSRGYLLTGEPGTGKTSVIKAISNHINQHIYSLNLSEMKSDTEMRTAFRQAGKRPIIVLEDIDCMSNITHDRAMNKDITNDKPTLSCLLNELDGTHGADGRIVIMTTNRKEVLDPALIRPGRIDMCIELTRCSRDTIAKFYQLMYEEELPENILTTLPTNEYTPAVVSNIFASFGKEEAIEKLRREIN